MVEHVNTWGKSVQSGSVRINKSQPNGTYDRVTESGHAGAEYIVMRQCMMSFGLRFHDPHLHLLSFKGQCTSCRMSHIT